MFAIVSISYTGFGATIADLSENSTTVSSDFDVNGIENVVVSQFELTANAYDDIAIVELWSVKLEDSQAIEDVRHNMASKYNYNLRGFHTQDNYRRARDGLTYA